VPQSGEGGIRTLDGGIHPHNALAGRRLQPLGHFSAGPWRIAHALFNGRTGQARGVLQRSAPTSRRLRGRRLQPLGHFSRVRGGMPTPFSTDSRAKALADTFFQDPLSGGGKTPCPAENELAGSPLIPRQSETRLRLLGGGFPLFRDRTTGSHGPGSRARGPRPGAEAASRATEAGTNSSDRAASSRSAARPSG
jgi:hypothetical protein